MYRDGAEFVAAETAAWQPYLALAELSDQELVQPVAEAHGWSGRDLIGHLAVWQDKQRDYAAELIARGTTQQRDADDAEYERRGDEMNDEFVREFSALSPAQVRERLAATNRELRALLSDVPATQWQAHQHYTEYVPTMLDHYADHLADVEAILAAAGR